LCSETWVSSFFSFFFLFFSFFSFFLFFLFIEEGKSAELLSTASCDQALKNKPLGKEQEIGALHNRGIIQLAKGDSEAARVSFELAVSKSSAVGMSHLALAQLVHKKGGFAYAIELYDSVLSSGLDYAKVRRNRVAIENNRRAALRANSEQEIAMQL
jgi:Tfp pilus assembly protein PilF